MTAGRLINLLGRWRTALVPPPLTCRAEFKQFVKGEAAYLAQKSVIGYCRVKTMYDFDKLMQEPAFRDGLDAARWRAFALTLGDVLVLAEQILRPGEEGARLRLADRLVEIYHEALNEEAAESGAVLSADENAGFASRMHRMRIGKCAPQHISHETARVIHEAVPIHPDLKRLDLEIIDNDLSFQLVALSSTMRRRMVKAQLLAALLGPQDREI